MFMENNVVEKYLPIIVKHLPGVTIERVRLFDDGHVHYVLLVDNLYAFRFPRTKGHGEKDHVVIAFLNKLAQSSPTAVQQMTGYIDEATGIKYQRYEFIPGVRLSIKMASTLTEQDLVDGRVYGMNGGWMRSINKEVTWAK